MTGAARGMLLLTATALAACATPRRRAMVTDDYGIRACPASAVGDLLSTDALQCWFMAPHGRWRTLSHESHYAVLVVQVEAADLRDAQPIAQRFVDDLREQYSEILIYVQREPHDARMTRRVRWTRETGFEQLDFDSSDK